MVARFIVWWIGGSLIVTPPPTGAKVGGGRTPADVSPIISCVQQSPLLEGNRASSCGLQSAVEPEKSHVHL